MDYREIRKHYSDHRDDIKERIREFEELKDADDHRLFKELVFVILTSQSSAKDCWKAVEELDRKGLLESGSKQDIADVIAAHGVRYELNKAEYIVENREKLSQPTLQEPDSNIKIKSRIKDVGKTRKWMAENLNGVGLKAASHFLRNIGYESVIISKYITDALYDLDYISEAKVPDSKEEYLRQEEAFYKLSEDLGLGVVELDLALWSMRTGEVFK